MNTLESIKPKNNLAKSLLYKMMKLNLKPYVELFGGREYCIGIKVKNPTEATMIGMKLGSGWGCIDYDIRPKNNNFIVFREALIQK